MKRIITIIILIACAKGVNAQEPYRSTVKEYVENNISMFEQYIDGIIKPLNLITRNLLTSFDDAQISALTENYRKSQFIDDLVDSLLIPVYKDAITLEDFQKQNALMQTPEGKIYQAHYAMMMKNAYGESEELKDFALRVFGYILKGTPLKDIKINKKIPQEYRSKYFQIADTSLVTSLTSSFLDLYKDQYEGKDELYNNISSYIKKNISTLVLNSYYKYMSIEDLDFILKQKEIGSQQRIKNAMKGMTDNITSYVEKIFAAYAKWLFTQKDVSEFLLQKIVEEANQDAEKDESDLTYKLDAEKLTLTLAGDKDMPDLEPLNKYLEKDKEFFLIHFVYEFPFFEDENLLRTIAYSQRNFSILLKNKKTGEKIELEYANQDIKNIVKRFHVLNLAKKGLNLYENNSYDKAFPLLKQAAEGGDVVAQYELSQMYYLGKGVNKDTAEAMKWLSAVSKQNEIKKYKADAFNNMAYYYVDQKQYDKALATIESAIETRPNEANYYDSKGEILYLMGNKKEAKEMWNKVTSIDPDFLKNHDSNLYRMLFKKKTR